MRKLLAICLMALLLFVQGVKGMHRHDYGRSAACNAAEKNAPAGEHFNARHCCTICDYQLTKDAELPQEITPPQTLSCQYIIYAFRPSAPYPGMPSVHANKGPPAMLL